MKPATLLSLLILFSLPLFAQNKTEIIKEAQQLIEQKKYQSAFELLEKADPDNNHPELVMEKVNIATNYFVVSIMHELFSFTDIAPDEDILDYRGKDGAYTTYAFPAVEALEQLIKKHPKNWALYKSLGDFYYNVHLHYGDTWKERDVLQEVERNYTIAYEQEVFDFMTLYSIGYINTLREDYSAALPYYHESIKLKKDYPTSHYNLAYSYLYLDQREEALKYAKNAYGLYTDSIYKADAARMVGLIHSELNDRQNAVVFFKQSNNLDPRNFTTLSYLIEELLADQKPGEAKRYAQQLFLIDPENPEVYSELADMYVRYDYPEEIFDFFNSKRKYYINDPLVLGNLYFHMAVVQLDNGDEAGAKENLSQARQLFKKVYRPDHYVFKLIKGHLEKLN